MLHVKCATHDGVAQEVSDKLNPLLDVAININRCPDGAPHITKHCGLSIPQSAPESLRPDVQVHPKRPLDATKKNGTRVRSRVEGSQTGLGGSDLTPAFSELRYVFC